MSGSATGLDGARPSLASRVSQLVRDTGNLARDHLELATLEAQQAAIGLTKVLVAAVTICILVVTAWLTFVAGGIVWATDAGVSWPVALLVAGIANLALAAGTALWIRGRKDELVFSATLRQLRRSAEEMKAEVP